MQPQLQGEERDGWEGKASDFCGEEAKAALCACLFPPPLSPPLPLWYCSCSSPLREELFSPPEQLTKSVFLQQKPLHPPP